jgi:hypothetical protein
MVHKTVIVSSQILGFHLEKSPRSQNNVFNKTIARDNQLIGWVIPKLSKHAIAIVCCMWRPQNSLIVSAIVVVIPKNSLNAFAWHAWPSIYLRTQMFLSLLPSPAPTLYKHIFFIGTTPQVASTTYIFKPSK